MDVDVNAVVFFFTEIQQRKPLLCQDFIAEKTEITELYKRADAQ
jgi:hypothetical protein